MRIWAEYNTTIINKFKDIIQHEDFEIITGRRLSIEKWVYSYINQMENLDDEKLKYLYNIFRNENCWIGTRLNLTILGKMLTEEKINGIKNPLFRYNIACRYCVIDMIPQLLKKQFETSQEEGDEPVSNNISVIKTKLHNMKYEDPVFTFWIKNKSVEFNSHDNALDGYKKAIEYKWCEGLEYFYNRLNREGKETKEKIEYMIIDGINHLSNVQADYNTATVFEFLLHVILIDPEKHRLLFKLSDKDKGTLYQPLSTLIQFGFVDTVHDLVKCLFKKHIAVPEEKRIISHQSYAILLSLLSNLMLEYPDKDMQSKARIVIMDFWKCGCFYEHRNVAVQPLLDIFTFIFMKRVLAMLIVDWKRDKIPSLKKKNELLKILQFAKDHCIVKEFKYLKKIMIKDLRVVKRTGMQDNFDYGMLADQLFSLLIDTDKSSENNDLNSIQLV